LAIPFIPNNPPRWPETVDAVKNIVEVYAAHARKHERVGEWIDRVGWEKFFRLTGIPFTDQARSADLVRAVLSLAGQTLRQGGTFLAKIFEGAEAEDVVRDLRASFGEVRRIRPAATRKESFELYLLARKYRGN